MTRIIRYSIFFFAVLAMVVSCEKTDNNSGSPSGKINNITAYYAGFDTINLTDSSEVLLDTNGYLIVEFEFECQDGLEQISGFTTGATVNFDTAGFIKGFGTWGEDFKPEGFSSNEKDNFSLKISSTSLSQETITFQIFGKNKLYSNLDFQFNSVVDSTLYK